MKVKLLKTGEIFEANDSYGFRLIEQGKAVKYVEPPAPPKPEKVKKAEPKVEPETKVRTTKSRKGE